MTTQQGETGGDVGTVELRGKVKWFNAVKGYGFLALDSDNSDAFLHVTTLRQSGHEDLKPGATVVCAGMRGPKGWQVMKVIEVDSSTAVAMAPKPPPVTRKRLPLKRSLRNIVRSLLHWLCGLARRARTSQGLLRPVPGVLGFRTTTGIVE